jgi:flagellar biosynthetic protein FlhB
VAEGDQPSEDRTEAATQRHADQAREAGQAPVSRELVTLVSLIAVISVIAYQSKTATQHLMAVMAATLAHAGDTQIMSSAQWHVLLVGLADLLLPIVIAAILAGCGTVLLQTRFLLHLASAGPK